MSEFVFLYHAGDTRMTAEIAQESMQKWIAWFTKLAEDGHVKDQGRPLERSGKIVKGTQKIVTDGPFAETKDVVGGYSLIQARDLDEAVELSKGCPILDGNGTVEVRPVVNLGA